MLRPLTEARHLEGDWPNAALNARMKYSAEAKPLALAISETEEFPDASRCLAFSSRAAAISLCTERPSRLRNVASTTVCDSPVFL